MANHKTFFKTSLLITVFNEADTISDLIRALKAQTLPPTEVIITDGGSKDGTFEKLGQLAKDWPVLRPFQVPGNRSVGRNFAVSKSRFPLLVFTDAGCIPEKTWLAEIVAPFNDSQTQVVSGYYRGLPENIFQKCLIPYVLVMPDRVDPGYFLPSTRSMAMRKSFWNKTGGFDPKLNHNEDYAFAVWMARMGVKFVFAPRALVGWMPRKNLKQSAWMFMRFAIGDIQAGILRPKVKFLILRYLAFAYFFFLAQRIHVLYYPLALLVLLYLLWAVIKNYRYVRNILAVIFLPLIQITADISVIFGTLMGYLAKANGLF